MPEDLKGRRAVVGGASAGIGRECARILAELGCEVLLMGRRQERLESLAEECGGRVLVCDWDDRVATVAAVRSELADGPIDIFINVSGGPPGGPILDAKPEDFQVALNRLVLTPHEILKALLSGMRENSYGRIVNVVSTSVYEPIPNLGVSNTIRGATAAWAKTLSKELPPCVTINNVLPGFTDTERLDALRSGGAKRLGISEDAMQARWMAMVPEKRLGTAREVAEAVAFLASPRGAFIRGVSLAVDGGRLNSI